MTELTESDPDDTTITWPAQGLSMEFSGEGGTGASASTSCRCPTRTAAPSRQRHRSSARGEGMIPVSVRVGATEWTTSLWPKNGRGVGPLKDQVRRSEDIEVGDMVTLRLVVDI